MVRALWLKGNSPSFLGDDQEGGGGEENIETSNDGVSTLKLVAEIRGQLQECLTAHNGAPADAMKTTSGEERTSGQNVNNIRLNPRQDHRVGNPN